MTTLARFLPDGEFLMLDAWLVLDDPAQGSAGQGGAGQGRAARGAVDWLVVKEPGYRLARGCWTWADQGGTLDVTFGIELEQGFQSGDATAASTDFHATVSSSSPVSLVWSSGDASSPVRFDAAPGSRSRAFTQLLLRLRDRRGGMVTASKSRAAADAGTRLPSIAGLLDWQGAPEDLEERLAFALGANSWDDVKQAPTWPELDLRSVQSVLEELRDDPEAPARKLWFGRDVNGGRESPYLIRAERQTANGCRDTLFAIDSTQGVVPPGLRTESLTEGPSGCCAASACPNPSPNDVVYEWLRAATDHDDKRLAQFVAARGTTIVHSESFPEPKVGQRPCQFTPVKLEPNSVVQRQTYQRQRADMPQFDLPDMQHGCEGTWAKDGSAHCLLRRHMDDLCLVLRRTESWPVIERVYWYDWSH